MVRRRAPFNTLVVLASARRAPSRTMRAARGITSFFESIAQSASADCAMLSE
jgi:hypothetical protein